MRQPRGKLHVHARTLSNAPRTRMVTFELFELDNLDVDEEAPMAMHKILMHGWPLRCRGRICIAAVEPEPRWHTLLPLEIRIQWPRVDRQKSALHDRYRYRNRAPRGGNSHSDTRPPALVQLSQP